MVKTSTKPADGETDALFRRYRMTRDRQIRNVLVERHLHLAEYHARRYASFATPREDVRQVARLGVIAAVERFDPDFGTSFSTFAGRTIDGECKRFLRDRGWTVRPPRQVQEMHLQVRRVQEEMTHQLGRAPSVEELSEMVGVSEERLIEALEAGAAQAADSIDVLIGGEGGPPVVDTALGGADPAFTQVDRRIEVERLLGQLDPRDRAIVALRFFANLSQPEIAKRVGVSQSYLSRLLRRILADLRGRIDEGPQ